MSGLKTDIAWFLFFSISWGVFNDPECGLMTQNVVCLGKRSLWPWEEYVTCSCWTSIDVNYISLTHHALNFKHVLIFCMLDLSLSDRKHVKVSAYNSRCIYFSSLMSLCLMYFEVVLLGAYVDKWALYRYVMPLAIPPNSEVNSV